jgi:hypothetical protein
MDKNKSKAMRITKGLGSASNYIGGDFDDAGYQKAPRQEKVAFINEEEEKK